MSTVYRSRQAPASGSQRRLAATGAFARHDGDQDLVALDRAQRGQVVPGDPALRLEARAWHLALDAQAVVDDLQRGDAWQLAHRAFQQGEGGIGFHRQVDHAALAVGQGRRVQFAGHAAHAVQVIDHADDRRDQQPDRQQPEDHPRRRLELVEERRPQREGDGQRQQPRAHDTNEEEESRKHGADPWKSCCGRA
ncbi:hypothetical protein QE438_002400 [Pseudoxanthomonas sp. SORGH_AS 997]|nr:hypothetical protein [Pseudoxanthomonas sp. SORGH_AS_0997]